MSRPGAERHGPMRAGRADKALGAPGRWRGWGRPFAGTLGGLRLFIPVATYGVHARDGWIALEWSALLTLGGFRAASAIGSAVWFLGPLGL